MTDTIKDKVVDFSSESKTSKAGKPYTVHTAVMETFGPVSLGFTKPETLSFEKNDTVAIEIEKKFGQWQMIRQVGIDTEPTLTTPPAAAPRSGGGFSKREPKVFPVPPTHGDMAIIHQNALTNAIKYAEYIYQKDGKPYTPDGIIDLAYQFADFSSGAHLAKLAKES